MATNCQLAAVSHLIMYVAQRYDNNNAKAKKKPSLGARASFFEVVQFICLPSSRRTSCTCC